MTHAIGTCVRNWRSNISVLSLYALMVSASSLGCAEVDATEELDEGSDPGIVETTDQAVVLPYSDPADGDQTWYARVKDNFTIELPNWRVHNNGCIGTCNVYLTVAVGGGGGGATDRIYEVRETYRGPDARDYDWSVSGLSFTVERKQDACFTMMLMADNPGDISAIYPKYCWEEDTRSWEPRGGGALAIGTAQSIYHKLGIDFSFTSNFRIRWDSTTMDGAIAGNQNSVEDGNDWHHLPEISLWNNPRSVNVRMENPSGSGDADLYTSSIGQPKLDSYECRPYFGAGNVEECSYSNRQSIWASVHNFSQAMAGYHLTITPTY